MSIGKNAIKRVENNGYSHVETHAPDMENSVVEPDPPEKELPEKKEKKTVRKKTPAKNGFDRVEIGADMPVWLL